MSWTGVVARLTDALETAELPVGRGTAARPATSSTSSRLGRCRRAIAAILGGHRRGCSRARARRQRSRARGGEIALLRALGLQGGQVTAVALLQALILSAVALAVGVPLGVASGRAAWDAIASSIGSQEPPAVPVLAVGVAVPLGRGGDRCPHRLGDRTEPAASSTPADAPAGGVATDRERHG